MDPFVRLLSGIDKEKVDIVVSSSTIATLADCHYANQWDIPLKVQLDSQGRKVVLLDKPFIKYVSHSPKQLLVLLFWVLLNFYGSLIFFSEFHFYSFLILLPLFFFIYSELGRN